MSEAIRLVAEIRIAIIGFGKIARDQHVPAIAASQNFRLVAAVSPRPITNLAVPWFSDHHAMLSQIEGLDAVAVATPPAVRYGIARDCLEAGLHVLLEKPPSSTLSEIEDLAALASKRGLTLFTAWHARFNQAVDAAAEILRREGLATFGIQWLENVQKWHPGQEWIWRPGGFGVFDAGINALSIATHICPTALLLRDAELSYSDERQTPITAKLHFYSPGAPGPLAAILDWSHDGPEIWQIDFTTRAGTTATLGQGGATLISGKTSIMGDKNDEYPAIYRCFETLVNAGKSLVEISPLRLVADACLVGRRIQS